MHGASLLPSHTRAITDILACRTEALGGHRWRCTQCAVEVHSYHSCKNRSCPTCHRDETERWLAARKTELLPCPYFHVTVTVPAELRDVLRANQKDGYAALIRAAAQSIIELARDKRYAGGTVGVLAVMHTWTGQLVHHPSQGARLGPRPPHTPYRPRVHAPLFAARAAKRPAQDP